MVPNALRIAPCPMPNIYNMKTIPDLPDILVQELERKWEAFKQSSATNKVNLPKDRRVLKALQHVFAFSDFVAKNCTRNPSLLSDLICNGDLQRR
jgi:glutamine synthetase adenylyltransferase